MGGPYASRMGRIAIIQHLASPPIEKSAYLLRHLVERWQRAGHAVLSVRSVRDVAPANCGGGSCMGDDTIKPVSLLDEQVAAGQAGGGSCMGDDGMKPTALLDERIAAGQAGGGSCMGDDTTAPVG